MAGNVVITQGMTSKMRVKLFDPKTNLMVSDRLVEQASEFIKGPHEVHKGPIMVEFNLYSQTQVDMAVEYLKKVKGDIPLDEIKFKKSKSKTLDKMLTDKEPLLDLLKAAKAKGVSQEKLIIFLREYKFRFIAGQVIQDMAQHDPEGVGQQIKLRERDIADGYQYMVRLVKEAKEPLNDKYDFRLVFGIRMIGKKVNKVVIYFYGEFKEYIKIPWDKSEQINFKKVERIYTFPEFMDYADRKKWRSEHRKGITWSREASNEGKVFEHSKFYLKFKPYVKGY